MGWAEDRMSTQVAAADWIPPDDFNRALDEDYEAGPIALNDPSAGLSHQNWHLTWDFTTGDFTVTPETIGSPSVVLNAAGVTQCSLAFDNNGHVNIAYTVAGGTAYLYWYDTVAAGWVTTPLEFGAVTPTLCLDDKRTTQTQNNDIILWYTKKQPDDTYTLYRRRQRDQFLTAKPMLLGIPPYIYKVGMHKEFRIQIGFSEDIL